MIGVSSLNLNNPFVLIMEKEYSATRKALVRYSKKSFITMAFFCVLDILIGILTANYFLYLFILIFSEIFVWVILRKTVKNTQLRKVNEIVFGEDYNIYNVNEADVYNTTRTLCKMNGVIEGCNRMLNFAISIHIVIAVSTLIQFFLERCQIL